MRRSVSYAEQHKRGCKFCLHYKGGCEFEKCPYRELDKYKTYNEYLEATHDVVGVVFDGNVVFKGGLRHETNDT